MDRVFSRVLIMNEEKEILVIRDREDEWNFPGGKLEKGENPIECAIREVKEEIGIKIEGLVEIFKGECLFDGKVHYGYFFLALNASGIPKMNEMGKIKGVQFIERLRDVNFSKGLGKFINHVSESKLLEQLATKWVNHQDVFA